MAATRSKVRSQRPQNRPRAPAVTRRSAAPPADSASAARARPIAPADDTLPPRPTSSDPWRDLHPARVWPD